MSGHQLDEWLAAANAVHISALALKRGRDFLQEAQAAKHNRNWLLAYSWADTRRMRQKGTNVWSNLGAGFDITLQDRAKIPPTKIGRQNGIDYIVIAPPAVLAACAAKVIDVAQDGRSLTLR